MSLQVIFALVLAVDAYVNLCYALMMCGCHVV